MYDKAVTILDTESLVIVVVYVGNLLIASNDIHLLTMERRKLNERYGFDDQDEVHYYFGVSIKQNRNKVCSQSSTEHILQTS